MTGQEHSLKKIYRYATRHKNIPNIPNAKNSQYRNSFLVRSISLYSSLSEKLKKVPTVASFVSQFKNCIHNRQEN